MQENVPTVAPGDSVARVSRAAEIARAAARVDLADDAAAQKLRLGRLLDHADKFMAERAAKTSIAARDLQIGAADPGERNPDESLARSARRAHLRESEPAVDKLQRIHSLSP